MKRTKVAAVVGGSVMALGVGSPAFAIDVDNALPKAQEGKQLLDSATTTTQGLNNPTDAVDVKALVGSVGEVTDTLKTKNDVAGTAIDATGVDAQAPQVPMIGGLPATGMPLG